VKKGKREKLKSESIDHPIRLSFFLTLMLHKRRRQQMISLIQKRHKDVPNERLQRCSNEELVYLMGGRISSKHIRDQSKQWGSISELLKNRTDLDPKKKADDFMKTVNEQMPTEEDWDQLAHFLEKAENDKPKFGIEDLERLKDDLSPEDWFELKNYLEENQGKKPGVEEGEVLNNFAN
jgi:hypothetical protein